MIRIKAVTVLHSSSAKFQKGGVADKIGLCARSGPFNLFYFFMSGWVLLGCGTQA